MRRGSRATAATGISIVIPAHNEALRIAPTLHGYSRYFRDRIELIVVPNGCTDATFDVVSSLDKKLASPMKILNFPAAIGKGGAIIEGFRKAVRPLIGFIDADGATTPQEFDRLCAFLGENDMIFGSRWISGATVYNRTSFLRRLASKSFVTIVKTMFGLPYHDTQCGVKVLTRDALHRILPYLSTTDSAFDVELLLLARQKGLIVREEPTVWTDNDSSVYSTSPMKFYRTSLSMFRSLLRLRARSYPKNPL